MIKCPECNAKVSIRTSRTRRNPNRQFYSCQGEDNCWIGWVDEIEISDDDTESGEKEIELNEDGTKLNKETIKSSNNETALEKCPECNAKVSIRTSRTRRNPNRQFYSCQGEDNCWIGWVDEFEISKTEIELNDNEIESVEGEIELNEKETELNEEEITLSKCPKCQSEVKINISRSQRNPNRKYYKCLGINNCWVGWVDEFELEDIQFIDELGELYEPIPRIMNSININGQSKDGFSHERSVKFFQSISCLPNIVEQARLSDKYNDLIRPISQWRLDYFNNKKTVTDSKLKMVTIQAINILNRGSFTYSTPKIREEFKSTYNNNFSEDELSKIAEHILSYPTLPLDLNKSHNIFGSELELEFWEKSQKFKSNYSPSLSIIPQLSLNSITKGADDSDKRVIDFFAWDPLNSFQPTVFEIDGPQHKNQKESDIARDEIIQSTNIDVKRINFDELKQDRNLFDDNDFSSQFTDKFNLEMASNIILSKYIHQIQLSTLYGILSGKIKFKSTKLTIGIEYPENIQKITNKKSFNYLIDLALSDISDLLSNLSKLYSIKVNIPTFEFNLITTKYIKTNDINIISSSMSKNPIKDFIISDISVPFNISTNENFIGTFKIKNPDKKAAEWLLNYLFDHNAFQEGQWEAIYNTLTGIDSILLLKTSGGKSLVYQFCGIVQPGISIIVAPLISLIDDQVNNLKSNGFDNVVGISSKLGKEDVEDILQGIPSGLFKYIYLSPERLQIESFRESIQNTLLTNPISNVAIDEAHCVSEWGHDFRTAYLKVADISREICKFKNKSPVITAMTGTASRPVLRDIQRELSIKEIIQTSNFDRSEIKFIIKQCSSDDKQFALEEILNSLPKQFNYSHPTNNKNFFNSNQNNSNCGIIFCPWVNGTYGIMEVSRLIENAITLPVLTFSGSSPKGINDIKWERIKSLATRQFRKNTTTTMTATKAFGMGIDKSNIRYTIHYNIPQSIESFYQECGRAGRDGNNAIGFVIISNDNPDLNKQLLDINTAPEDIKSIIDEMEFNDNDDISRMMFFHTQSYQGSENDISKIYEVYDLIKEKVQTLNQKSKFQISWEKPYDRRNETMSYERFNNINRENIEKPIHRFSILGIVDDYTVDHSAKIFNVRLSGISKSQIINNLISYVTAFRSHRPVDPEILNLEKNISKYSYNDYVKMCSEELVNFIYSTIEKSRRQALNTMLLAQNETPERFRARILSYLNSENQELEEILDNIENSESTNFEKDKNLIISLLQNLNFSQAFELRGSIERRLEDNPEDFELRLLRFGAELFCEQPNTDVVVENIRASINFSKYTNQNLLDTIIEIIQLTIDKKIKNIDYENILIKLFSNKELDNNMKLDLIKKIGNQKIFKKGGYFTLVAYNLLSGSILNKTKELNKILN